LSFPKVFFAKTAACYSVKTQFPYIMVL